MADGEIVLQSYGDGFESAMVKVYGASIINDCFYIDTEKNGIKIHGFLGKPGFDLLTSYENFDFSSFAALLHTHAKLFMHTQNMITKLFISLGFNFGDVWKKDCI